MHEVASYWIYLFYQRALISLTFKKFCIRSKLVPISASDQNSYHKPYIYLFFNSFRQYSTLNQSQLSSSNQFAWLSCTVRPSFICIIFQFWIIKISTKSKMKPVKASSKSEYILSFCFVYWKNSDKIQKYQPLINNNSTIIFINSFFIVTFSGKK